MNFLTDVKSNFTSSDAVGEIKISAWNEELTA